MLSKLQKSIVAKAARAAWNRISILERKQISACIREQANDPLLSDSKIYTQWRHQEQHRATGISSLCLCDQPHYLPLINHFNTLGIGYERSLPKSTINAIERELTDSRRRAEWLLLRALNERNLQRAYAEAICRRQFRCNIAQAAEKQIWNLIFTIRNRRKSA
jgi:hypothetical protein